MRRRTDEGATAVEFALILVPLLTLIFGATDFGLYEYQQSQAAAAARDGARVAILKYQNADVTTSTDYAAIDAAVKGRLGIKTYAVTAAVTCSTSPCSSATLGKDTITVTVTTSYRPMMPVIAQLSGLLNIKETATQKIVGLPS